jgi:hypothetical protein
MNVIFSAKTVRNTLFLLIALFFFYEAFRTFTLSPLLTAWDFQAFWGGARALNLGLDPYDPSTLHKLSNPAPFANPLFLAEMLQPLAHLPLMAAKMIWDGLNFIEAAVTIVILLHVSKMKLTPQSFILGAALLMAFEPFSGTIYLGQTATLVVLALALSWLLLEQRRLFLAGLVFCLGATNPYMITGVGLYYLYRSFWKREYKLLLGMAAGGALLVATFLIHPSYSKDWFTTFLSGEAHSEAQDMLQITLVHLFTYFLGNLPHAANYAPLLATIISLVIGFIACVFSIKIWSKSGGKSAALDMAIAVVLTVIASPFDFHQDLLIIVLVAPSLLMLLQQRSISVNKVAFLFLCASTFLFSSLTGFIDRGVYEFRLPFYYYAPFLSIALLLLAAKTTQPFYKHLPWLTAFTLLSLVGSYLPLDFGIPIIQYEKIGIFIGLFLFIVAMWRWHPALTSSSASARPSNSASALNDAEHTPVAPEAAPAGAGASLAITRWFKRT